MALKILPATDVRNRLSSILTDLRKEGTPCFLTRNGRAVAALLSMEAYEHLMSELEDRLDESDDALAHEVEATRRECRAGKTTRL
jgi:prevent-host-death family protein